MIMVGPFIFPNNMYKCFAVHTLLNLKRFLCGSEGLFWFCSVLGSSKEDEKTGFGLKMGLQESLKSCRLVPF